MDSSRKPERRNPREGVAAWSQLLFAWVVPVLWRGCRDGINTDQLTQCMPRDDSATLGDQLESAWAKEQTLAKRKQRKPRLRRALFSVFVSSTLVDGLIMLQFVLVKTLLPVVLAQLLKQFQPPIELLNATTLIPSTTSPATTPFNDTFDASATILLEPNRTARSAPALPPFDLDARIESFGSADPEHTLPTLHRVHRALIGATHTAPDFPPTTAGAEAATSSPPLRQPVTAAPAASLSDHSDELQLDDDLLPQFRAWFAHAWTDMRWLGGALIALTCIGFLSDHHADLRQQLVGGRMRIACCSLIYRKTLRLSKRAAGQTAAGYLVNLLSNDVTRLDWGFVYAHYVWILPLQSVLVTWLIWQQVGWAALVGVCSLLVLCIPVQTGLSRLLSQLRIKVARRTDQRVGIMNEIIVGIQVIKMYAWERPFRTVVSEARRKEVREVRFASYIRGINMCTMIFMERATLFITICACVLMGQRITADVVFSMAQFFNALQMTAAIFYPLALALGAEALVSIDRVEEFLLQEERIGAEEEEEEVEVLDKKPSNGTSATTAVEEKALLAGSARSSRRRNQRFVAPTSASNAIELAGVSASWGAADAESAPPATLADITFSVPAGTLCAIIGPVGAGKSSLLHLLLGELPLGAGGRVALAEAAELSYASQEPWLFAGTVRHNILFGLAYDQRRYHEVVQCCALTTDFQQLPQGDRTVVGERGTALSGGQRARISLARAVYKEASVYLLDDPLSAVDAHVGKHLFDEVIGPNGRLAKLRQTRLLVTHQVHFLKEADLIVILDGGRVLRQGTWAELAASELDFAQLLTKAGDDEAEKKKGEATEPPAGDSDAEHEDGEDIPYIDGAVGVVAGYQPLTPRRKSASQSSQRTQSNKSLATSAEDCSQNGDDNDEEQADGSVSLAVWRKYFRAGGTVCALVALLVMLIGSQVVTSGSDYFVNYWTQQEDLRVNGAPTRLTQHECLYIYGALILAVIAVCFLRGFMFFNICMHASKVLHDRMFVQLLLAPMRFFDTNPSGRILNRFSKDMGAIDEMLPKAMMESIQIGLVMVGILVMVSVLNPLMIGVLCVAVAAFAGILKLYMRPSQDLKRLEGISRSPVFSHLSASLTGISTIRSCGLQQRLITEFDDLQNVHSGVWQLAQAANHALALWLDCVSAAFVASVTFTFIGLYDSSFSGNVGLAISQSLILTGMVAYGVRQTTVAMQQMTSVERVLQYTDLEPESQPDAQPPANWPSAGRVQFRNMSLRYSPHDPPTLVELTIDIAAGWKVGIVGRTGAGKSSLISALFRLAPITGDILIDGIETGTITLDSLRSAIAIIPQDPVLFSATVRNNLDPFGRYSDDQLWQALAAVELGSAIQSLDFMVTEAGANFSVGQRQLICLARAILRGNRVLVLDEATANVDPQTDALIQRTIRERFAECTVLTVAHRLHTVMDSDRIVVMDAGRVREFDWPAKLLAQEGGVLRDMVEATGPQEAASLRAIAERTMEAKEAQQRAIEETSA